ncbi:hypothetical protein [Streptomyces sp. NBC_00576]|uniref:hypothetical protein n=1 Tax=Streptomyces sp. NBC_00576 TaxID=2903665 RepID=UPI002E81F5D8|nr:hypothetical protein [Streptomyces sp. NBC_00576]WUB76989.1 hypothetical protein OG734_47040 [Streptomyces sp. NBC_00576]
MPTDDPDVRRLVLGHIERRRRNGLREAVERSLAQRLLGGESAARQNTASTSPLQDTAQAL